VRRTSVNNFYTPCPHMLVYSTTKTIYFLPNLQVMGDRSEPPEVSDEASAEACEVLASTNQGFDLCTSKLLVERPVVRFASMA